MHDKVQVLKVKEIVVNEVISPRPRYCASTAALVTVQYTPEMSKKQVDFLIFSFALDTQTACLYGIEMEQLTIQLKAKLFSTPRSALSWHNHLTVLLGFHGKLLV